jgi:SAM-dependent methyltransferase
MNQDPYDVFARVYDVWQAGYPKPFAEAIYPFYRRELLLHGVPEPSLADLACGTGAFLKIWARRHPGWSLLGTDQSAGMLDAARRSLTRAGLQVPLLHQKLQDLNLPHPVGAAVSIFDSVNHLTRLEELRRFVRGVARSLNPGGLFIFDLNDERAFPNLFSGSWTVEAKGLFVSITASCWADGLRGALHFTVFERRTRGWERWDFEIQERNWRRQEVKSVLSDAGFRILRCQRIQPYDSGEFEAPRTLWSCRLTRRQGTGTWRRKNP